MASKVSRRPHPPSAYSYRRALQERDAAKICYFYKDGDYTCPAVKMAVHPRYHRGMGALFNELSSKVKLPYGVRNIFTPEGRDKIRNIESLEHEGHYVCSMNRYRADRFEINRLENRPRWNNNKPPSGQRDLNSILHDPEHDEISRVKFGGRYGREHKMAYAYNKSRPKKITVMQNGEPQQRHILLLNRRTAQTFEQILHDLSEMFPISVQRLYTVDGRRVMSLSQLFQGPDALVAAANEPFKHLQGYKPQPPPGQPSRRGRPGNEFVADKLKNRRDRLLRTRGQWKVWVTTNELSSAGTTAQVTLTVYGHRGQASVPLGFGDGQHFQNGHIDEFDISVGSVGEIYKIRIGHDNTGDFPSWRCDEVRIRDRDTGEELVFPFKRWMGREEDDHEICRELPAVRRGDPHLSVIKYEVTVVTGNLWNAGTDANVYLTVYGDRGDTGVRQLYGIHKDQLFKKGQTDNFTVEAVNLGKLKRVIVGHDGTSPGEGWYLEKIMIQEPNAKPHEVYTFLCNKWLDEGEDDGKIVREIKVQDEYMEDILAKRNWEYEKWKFENKNQVMFFSMVTGKALRIKSDGSVDGLGEETDTGAIFTVSSKKPMVRIFTSLLNQNFHLAIDNGKIVGHGRGGPYCEFRLHVQTDCTVMMEGVKNPLQFVSLQENGKLGDPRGLMDGEPSKRFYVYCKGMIRHRGIIMLRTSNTQAINVDHNLNLYGTGKCHRGAHFRVHKVESGGVRLFESMVHPGKYLRLQDGKIDCQGGRDEKSHFLVQKHHDKGYITLQSKIQRGIFVGLTPKGEVRPTVDTGVNNIWLFPEVIEFGVSRKNLGEDKLTPISEHDTVDTHRSSEVKAEPRKKQKSDITDGDWRVTTQTVENLENGQVALVVYGDKGHSGPIMLNPPVKNGPAFRAGCADDFKVNLLKVGQLYKIRLELVSPNASRTPTWKVGQVKMVDLNHKNELVFKFDRWLSRHKDDGEIMRELPVISKGKEALPVRTYHIRVYTGKETCADTNASVYLNLFGEHGDFGKRVLLKSNNKVPFQKGQVDKFEIEAVSLGQLTQCLVGHDATRVGDGWFLETIVVRETKNSSREYTFPCNKWLDAGREDRKIERLLPVKETSDSKPPSAASRKSTQVYITAVPHIEAVDTADPQEEPVEEEPPDNVQSIPKSEPDISDNVEELFEDLDDEKEETVAEEVSEEKVEKEEIVDNTDPVEEEEEAVTFKTEEDEVIKTDTVEEEEEAVTFKTEEDEVIKTDTVEEEEEAVTFKTEEDEVIKTDTVEEEEEAVTFKTEEDEAIKTEAEQNAEAGEATEDEDVTFPLDDDDVVEDLMEETKETEAKVEVETKEVQEEQEEVSEVEEAVTEEVKEEEVSEEAVTEEVKEEEEVTEEEKEEEEVTEEVKEEEEVTEEVKEEEEVTEEVKEEEVSEEAVTEEVKEEEEVTEEVKEEEEVTEEVKDVTEDDEVTFGDDEDDDLLPEVQHKEKTPPPQEEEKPEPGTWRLLLSTGREADMGCQDTVMMYAYGSRGSVGPILIGHGEDGVFQPGNTDEFKIKINRKETGKLYKIRVGMAEETFGAQWFLDRIIMVDLVEGDTLEFRVQRWLSRKHDDFDVWRELPVSSAGETPLPVHIYELQVRTGEEVDADTEAEVFVTLFGERGDSGRRRLYKSKSDGKPFSRGKVDIFTVEAVSLGPLSRVVVGHNETKAGDGWYLGDITVTASDRSGSPHTYFPCNRWLDAGKGDGKTEVELVPGDKPQESTGEYQVWVKTATDSSPAKGGKVSLAVYGSKGHSKDIELFAPNKKDHLFEPGNVDEFEAAFGPIGEIQKLRVYREDTPSWKAWHLDEIKLKDKATGQNLVFVFDRWFSRSMDDHDLVRELPALKNNKPVSTVCHYEVTTFTGDHWAGGTDAAVYITLIGSKGDSGKRSLYTPPDSLNTFRVAQEDTFNLEAVDLGDLTSVVIGHSSKGHGAGWFLDKVNVKVKGGDGGKFVFPCMRWLDAGEDDGKIERELRQIDVPDLLQIAPMSSRNSSTGEWQVFVKTSDVDGAATCAQVYLTVYGSKGVSPILPLGDGSPNSDNFWRGKEAKFKVNVGKVGEIRKIRLEHDNRNPDPAWHVESVRMVDTKTEEELFFPVNRWLAEDKEDGQLHRECPLMSPGAAPVPVLRYLIAVQTGRQRSAGASEGWISVNLIGRQGDTGQQLLQRPLSNPADKMSPGKLDVYVLESVSVGTLQSLRLVFEGKGRAQKWFVDRVLVLESVGALEEAVFDFNCWLDTNDDNAKQVSLTDIQTSSFLTDDITYRLLGSRLPESEGHWEASMWTANSSDAGTKDSVLMVLYGTTGQTEPKALNKDYAFNPGSVVKLQIDTGRIGALFKIRLMFGDRSGNSSWTMERLKLKDLDTGQEFHFDQHVQVESSPQNPDGATELPAVRPDIAPLPETTYLVTVSTGTQERADTEAEISCTLIGRWGDTGERVLSESKSHGDPFQKGKTDEFELKTLYLGDISKILIGHNENGRGCGWFCRQVTVQALDPPATDKKAEVVFACNRWLDSGCEDRRLMRELTPAGCILPAETAVDKSSSHGVWCCSITMAAEDKLDASLSAITLPEQVSIVVYGTRGVNGPLRLQDSNRDLFLLGKTDKFEDVVLGDIGDIRKLRVCAGREDDDNPVWMVEQVTLEDVHSHEVLHFDFSRWVGQVGGDIQHEVPVLLPGYQAPAVLQYEVRVQTEHGKEAGTNAAVFINLYGKNGDSGRRRLVKPSPGRSPPFQSGQTDVFIIEAVDLGDLEKVVVTKGPGKPWQLSQVKVRAGLFSSLSHVFIWSNAVGDGRDEMKEVDITIPVISSWPAPVAVPADQVDDLPTSGGQWSVEVLTGKGGVSGEGTDLVLVMCGDRGESAPIRFHSKRDRPFQPRQPDTAEVHLAQDVGDLMKVRLGFADNSKNKALDIARIKFEDTDTHDNFSYVLNSRVEVTKSHDGWTEFPVIWPAVHILPVVKYRVEVTTGSVPNGDTKARVYIQLHGRMGSTGRRQLKKALNNNHMFQLGQTDRFELEAVSLMSVDKVVIGHHSATAGDGWFLKRVVVTPQGDDECVFECNRWLDGGEDDGRIERTLSLMDEPAITPTPDLGPPLLSARDPSPVASPAETPAPPPAEKAHKWRVWTTTGSKPKQGTSNPVVLVLYGDKGHSEPLLIGHTSQLTFRFTEGQTQDFQVETDVDVGKVYKVRVGFAAEGKEQLWYSDFVEGPSWFLKRLKIEEVSSGQQYVFEAQKWLHVDKDGDHWREFPVYHRREEDMLPVHDYQVEVFTGDKFGAGTDANVYLQIFGERGDTGKRHLHGTKTEGKMFENGMHDVFVVEAVDLGRLNKVNISHDGLGAGSGWFLDSITVKSGTTKKFVFNCERWLDVDEDDGAIERELPVSGVITEETQAPTGYKWQVWTTTGSQPNQHLRSPVVLVLYGDKGHSEPLQLGHTTQLAKGKTQDFEVETDVDVGKVYKVRVGFAAEGKEQLWYSDFVQSPSWFLERLKMEEKNSGQQYVFEAQKWLRVDKDGDHWREFPVYHRREEDMLPVHDYQVEVFTGDKFGAGTDANVYLQIFGERGDTGKRHLHGTKTEGKMFENGMHDVFVVEAVDLGRLNKVNISHDGLGAGSGWFLDSITVKQSQDGKEKFVFKCGKWLDVDEEDGAIERELPVSDVVADKKQGPGAGEWEVLIMTSLEEESGTDARVTLTVFGKKGNSGPLPLGSPNDGCFQTGHTDQFDIFLDPEEIGRIAKIRLEHDNSGLTAGWRVEKMIMRNEFSGDELVFIIDRWLSFSEKQGDIVFEAAAEWPNEKPLQKHTYLVKTVTPGDSGAGTNADVHLTLVGSRGDSGRRELKQNLEEHSKFQPGMTDSFVIEAVDLGRLEKVVIGLSGAGFRSSWKLQCVVVRVSEKESFVFPWGKFLNDETPEAEIALAEVVDDYTDAEVTGLTPRDAPYSP